MARASRRILFIAVCAAGAVALAGCEGGVSGAEDATNGSGSASVAVSGEERDVEAPEVFQASESGLWDGRPSLGGVWVAHPDVEDPERVLIENTANGQTVIGALFRRERDNPGPIIQVSSDAAAELGMLAGQPAQLSVTALRREVVETPAPAVVPEAAPIETVALDDDPIAGAAAAIDAAEGAEPIIQPAESAPAPVATPASTLDRPYIQIGIFSVEGNANNAGASLRNSGIIPTVLRQESQGKTFWRVIVGPATTEAERSQVLARVKDLGYSDAYFVSN